MPSRHHTSCSAQWEGESRAGLTDGGWYKGPHLLYSASVAQSVNGVGGFQGQQADLFNGDAAFSNPVSHNLLQGSRGQQKEEISWYLTSHVIHPSSLAKTLVQSKGCSQALLYIFSIYTVDSFDTTSLLVVEPYRLSILPFSILAVVAFEELV